jgi:GNAT superfamily N-acetyltransferase
VSRLVIRPLTPALWPKLEDLFGRTGACAGCWCMYWRVGSQYTKRPRAKNKADFRAVVKKGPPPGLLAFAGGTAVGWCQVTPRAALPHLARGRFTRAIDDTPAWVISCFYVRKGWRGRGVMSALIEGAIRFAGKYEAPALEAYPVKTDGAKRSNSGMYTGSAAAFERAGFETVARAAPDRPIMRYAFR